MQRQTALALVLALSLAGCNGMVGEGEAEDTGAAYEPDEEEGRQIFTSGLAAGTKAEVCKTGGDGLNLRRGAGKNHGVITVMAEGHDVTILGSSGSWYRIRSGGTEGYSYEYYLCAASGGGSTGGGSTGGGSTGGGSTGGGGCTGGFVNPAPGKPVTSEFGACRDGCSRTHGGIDLGVPIGTAIRASDGGVVEFAGWMSGYGYAVDVNHCGKLTTRYAHLSSFVAHQGAKVGKGDTIAKSGNTGNSTGPHLHFEIRIGGRWGTAVNPRKYVQF